MIRYITLLTILLTLVGQAEAEEIVIRAYPNSVTVHAKEKFNAGARYTVKAYNNSDVFQKYYYYARSCPELNECKVIEKTISIAPHDWFVDDFVLSSFIWYNTPGQYDNRAFIRFGNVEHERSGIIKVYE